MGENMVDSKKVEVKDIDTEERKEIRERRLLDRKPKTKAVKDLRLVAREEEGEEIEEVGIKKKRKPPEGEIDYGWCEEETLPSIETTFNDEEDIIHEHTNRKVIR